MPEWIPVTRLHPCPICKKPDWCCIGEHFVNCMRIANDHPCKNGGWLYRTDEKPRFVRLEPVPLPPKLNVTAMMRRWLEQTSCVRLRGFADRLGVGPKALASIGCAWAEEHKAWAFPMRDGYGEPIGIRLRNEEGKKWAVSGSKQGLFTSDFPSPETAFVTEGPTDLAAALTIGIWAVGRPSCCCGSEQLRTLFKKRGVRRAVILSDNDAPGINGAQRLAAEIALPCALLILPAKDCREFVRNGGTRELIETMLRDTVWRQPIRALRESVG